MGSISGDSATGSERDDPNAHEEKIFVSVRLRPLNDKELAKNEVSDWECINDTTIIFKNSLQERTMLPTAYTFDRVFGCDCPTRQVYEEAAKRVALSVLSGINSSIFAYGQTSSGKTYTMSGVTEAAIVDIYDYVYKHREREFVLKFSAIEIYNESVRDLLSTDSTPLRLLDDPEKGTVVDKLSEVTLRDLDHLRELLSICEAQRQIGETNLNEMSSRSHQILRLTVESSAREYVGAANSSALTASVSFIDLAGSECASQTLSAGTRLKEGCHINRSLLTLGTVIRKLSKGRNGHVPYRDSKLTRILQNSLGGNARTAIICTMSPAHSHVEKSRNTLLFASCAKQVNTNARVNVVMSEKALVKQLQKELARLENELRKITSLAASSDSSLALKEKEMLIEKMDKEIRELTAQRDQARAEDIAHTGGESQTPRSWGDHYEKRSWGDDYSISEASEIIDTTRSDVVSRMSHFSDRCEGLNDNKLEEPFLENSEVQFLSDDTSPREYIEKYFGPDPCKGWEKMSQENNKNFTDNCKEVQCIETEDNNTIASTMPTTHAGEHELGQSPCSSDDEETSHMGSVRSKSCTDFPMTMPNPPSAEFSDGRKCKSFSDFVEQPLEREDDDQVKVSEVESIGNDEDLCIKDLESSITINSTNNNEETIKILVEDCTAKQQDERIKPKSETQFEDNTDLEVEKASKEDKENGSKNNEDVDKSPLDWSKKFERERREIIELWDACNTPLVHRSYFLLLFKGDPSDAVYMEVELRRLSFLKNSSSTDQASSKSSRAINKEREMLSKQMLKKYSTKEREALFEKWGINLKSKHRRNQLCRRLWTDSKNMDHIHESAAIVAKLVGFQNENHAPKEMFGLSFSLKPTNLKSNSWRHSLPLMM